MKSIEQIVKEKNDFHDLRHTYIYKYNNIIYVFFSEVEISLDL